MAETLEGKWKEFRKDYERKKTSHREPWVERMTRFEKDYGPLGKYRRLEPDVDQSAGSEFL